MTEIPYEPPVSRLLKMGEPRDVATRFDLAAAGITPEHVPELIRMAQDPFLSLKDPDDPAYWGPVYAWRALGQLRASSAIPALLRVLKERDETEADDWVYEEISKAIGRIGPAAIPGLIAFANDASIGLCARAAAGDALMEVALSHAEARSTVIAALTQLLERYAKNEEEINAFLIGHLVRLKAVHAAPLMKAAFQAERVDEFVIGWRDVRAALKLKPEPDDPVDDEDDEPRPVFSPGGLLSFFEPILGKPAKDKLRAKRKQQRKARKQNRKRR